MLLNSTIKENEATIYTLLGDISMTAACVRSRVFLVLSIILCTMLNKAQKVRHKILVDILIMINFITNLYKTHVSRHTCALSITKNP